MSVLTWLTGKKDVVCRKAEGIDIALQALGQFEGRTFTVKDGLHLHRAVTTADVRTYIQTQLPQYYNYQAQLTTYTDRNEKQQVRIILKGHIGLSRQLQRYNPMDLRISIRSKP